MWERKSGGGNILGRSSFPGPERTPKEKGWDRGRNGHIVRGISNAGQGGHCNLRGKEIGSEKPSGSRKISTLLPRERDRRLWCSAKWNHERDSGRSREKSKGPREKKYPLGGGRSVQGCRQKSLRELGFLILTEEIR